jgi:16S rRNA (cytidine1402-2'-O)-methyltransferase
MERRWVEPGTLYVVATPIGNLADMAPRGLSVLREVDQVYAEDTRVSGPWLRREGVTAPIRSFHEHSPATVEVGVIEALLDGQAVAIISDAGMPTVSDPGQGLVARAWEAGVRVVPVPGANAALAAFMVSGFALPMTVWGFLPARGEARRRQVKLVAEAPGTQVLYESPHRVATTLALLAEIGPADRLVTIARELTKMHEEVWRGSLGNATQRMREGAVRGEFTLVLGPRPAAAQDDAPPWAALLEEVDQLVTKGASPAEACRMVAKENGATRRDLYRRWALRQPNS